VEGKEGVKKERLKEGGKYGDSEGNAVKEI
jgi:hypothetical protein